MKEGKSQKNFKISIRAKILTGMIACVLIVTNLIGWFFIVQAKDTLLEQCKNNARNSAKIAAERIDGDILGQIKAGDEKTENYKEILSQLQDFLCGDDIKYIYTMRMNGDRLEFCVTAQILVCIFPGMFFYCTISCLIGYIIGSRAYDLDKCFIL